MKPSIPKSENNEYKANKRIDNSSRNGLIWGYTARHCQLGKRSEPHKLRGQGKLHLCIIKTKPSDNQSDNKRAWETQWSTVVAPVTLLWRPISRQRFVGVPKRVLGRGSRGHYAGQFPNQYKIRRASASNRLYPLQGLLIVDAACSVYRSNFANLEGN